MKVQYLYKVGLNYDEIGDMKFKANRMENCENTMTVKVEIAIKNLKINGGKQISVIMAYKTIKSRIKKLKM